MFGITVEKLVSLLTNNTQIQIYTQVNKKTYQFDTDNIPNEFLYCLVQSIDDPYNNSEPHPLCININGIEEFDDIPEIEAMFKDCEINTPF